MFKHLRPLVLTFLAASCGGTPSTTTPTTSSVVSVTLSPGTDSIVAQQTVQFTASPKDASGATVSDATVSWSVTPSSIATVSSSGMVTGVASGAATVTAQSNGKSATAAITVTDGGIVSTSGATLTGMGGAVTIVLPANAVTTPLPISIQPMLLPPSSPTLVKGSAVEFGPTGTQFAQPVTIKLHYTPAQLQPGTDPSQLQLYVRNGNSWTVVPGSTVDTSTQTVIGTATHFSTYAACEGLCVVYSAYVVIGFPYGYNYAANGDGLAPGTSMTAAGLEISGSSYAGPVAFAISGLPPGMTASAFTTQLTPDGAGNEEGTFSVTVHAAANLAPQRYGFTITGSGNGVTSGVMIFNMYVIAPSFTITPSQPSLSITQGTSNTSALALARVNFTGSVAFTAENLPTGVTATLNPPSTTSNASSLMLNVAASAVPGNYNITIRGSGTGISDVLTTIFLTIAPASGFTLAGTPAFVSVSQLGSASTGVQATRLSGFSGAIAYAVSGLPAGLTAVITTTSVADSVKVTFTAAAGLAAGNYPVTITGTSGSKSIPTILSVTVAPPGTVTVHLDYSTCDPSVKPIWVAYQDGNGVFTPVTGAGDVYSFNLTSGKGAAAVVAPFGFGTGFSTNMLFGAASELSSMAFCSALPPPTGKTLNITVLNAPNTDGVNISMPSGTTLSWAVGALGNVQPGTQDVIGFRYNLANPTQDVRAIILRGINLPNGGTITTPIDFAGSASFIPVQGTLAVGNVNGEQLNAQLLYLSEPSSCSNTAFFMGSNPASATTTVYGFPASLQLSTDLHLARATTPTRYVDQWFHTFASQTITFGGALPTPSITTLSGPYKRPQVTVNVPSDYPFAGYSWSGSGNGLGMFGSAAYFGGQTMTLTMPDLSAVAGYNVASWAPAAGSGNYFMIAKSALTETCSDGSTFRQAGLMGTN